MMGLVASMVLGFVGVSSERGVAVVRSVPSASFQVTGGWTVDGNAISVVSTAGNPSTFRLAGSDSLVSNRGTGVDAVFLKIGTTPASPNPAIDHERNDSLWWRVKGQTGSWAMVVDSSKAWYGTLVGQLWDYTLVRARWARIHDGQPWVRWIDTIHNDTSELHTTVPTWTGLLRGLRENAGVVDSLWGEVRSYHGIVWADTSIHFRAEIALASSDTGHPFCARSISDRGETTASGVVRNAVLGPYETLRAKTSFTWSSSSPMLTDSSYDGRKTVCDTAMVVWKYRIGARIDSVVALGPVPQVVGIDETKAPPGTTRLAPRSPLRASLRSPLSVDPRGRRIPSSRSSDGLHDLLRRGEGIDLTAH